MLLGGLIFGIILVGAVMIDIAMGNISGDENPQGVPVVAILVYIAIMLWPGLALNVKRWHDRDKSGWYVLTVFIPIVGPIWSFVELGFLRGSIGPNRYGSDSVPHY